MDLLKQFVSLKQFGLIQFVSENHKAIWFNSIYCLKSYYDN